MTDSGQPTDLDPGLVAHYRSSMAARRVELQDAAGRLEGDGAEVVRRIAHRLRGSGATYGFPDISQRAAEVEHAAPSELAERLGALISLLDRESRGTD